MISVTSSSSGNSTNNQVNWTKYNLIHIIVFEMEKNPRENPTFEITLKEPFEKRGIKTELDPIPQRSMKNWWWNSPFTVPKYIP